MLVTQAEATLCERARLIQTPVYARARVAGLKLMAPNRAPAPTSLPVLSACSHTRLPLEFAIARARALATNKQTNKRDSIGKISGAQRPTSVARRNKLTRVCVCVCATRRNCDKLQQTLAAGAQTTVQCHTHTHVSAADDDDDSDELTDRGTPSIARYTRMRVGQASNQADVAVCVCVCAR